MCFSAKHKNIVIILQEYIKVAKLYICVLKYYLR